MNAFELILLSTSLAIDCFAVSCVIGVTQPQLERKYVWRFSFFFGLFQGLMPLAGWLLGESVVSIIGKVAPYIAFAILCFLGCRMILESVGKNNSSSGNTDVRKMKNVLLLATATSIDALAVGFSFAMINEKILVPVIAIGITSFIISFASYNLSSRISNKKIGKYAGIFGGIVLISIGMKILFF